MVECELLALKNGSVGQAALPRAGEDEGKDLGVTATWASSRRWPRGGDPGDGHVGEIWVTATCAWFVVFCVAVPVEHAWSQNQRRLSRNLNKTREIKIL